MIQKANTQICIKISLLRIIDESSKLNRGECSKMRTFGRMCICGCQTGHCPRYPDEKKNRLKKRTVFAHVVIEKILRFLHSITSNKKSRVDRRSCNPACSPFFRAGSCIKNCFNSKLTISFSVSSRENGLRESMVV